MLGLCIHYDPHPQRREWWSYVAGWYGIDHIWEIGQPPDVKRLTRFLPEPVSCFEDLPDYPLIVFQPKEGRYVHGVVNIDEFDHPEDAIYGFGFDHGNLEPINKVGVEYVYVPVKKYEMLAAFAATVALEHRSLQWGR